MLECKIGCFGLPKKWCTADISEFQNFEYENKSNYSTFPFLNFFFFLRFLKLNFFKFEVFEILIVLWIWKIWKSVSIRNWTISEIFGVLQFGKLKNSSIFLTFN